nr:MAG TPA: hypothetical protein [Caudoviricetes sp.]
MKLPLKVSLLVLRMEKMVYITLPLTVILSSHPKFQSRRKISQKSPSCGSSEIRSPPGKPLSARRLGVTHLLSRKPSSKCGKTNTLSNRLTANQSSRISSQIVVLFLSQSMTTPPILKVN